MPPFASPQWWDYLRLRLRSTWTSIEESVCVRWCCLAACYPWPPPPHSSSSSPWTWRRSGIPKQYSTVYSTLALVRSHIVYVNVKGCTYSVCYVTYIKYGTGTWKKSLHSVSTVLYWTLRQNALLVPVRGVAQTKPDRRKRANGSHRIKLCIRLFFNITIADSNAFLAPLLRPPERGGEVLFGDGSYYPTPCLLEGLLGYRDACQLQILSSGTQNILMATGPAKKVVARRSRCSSPPGRPARWRGNWH
jgi:hypothetical protein